MIDPEHPQLSIVRQCELVSISRSGFYYRPAGETPLNLELMRLIDQQFLETPWYGSRQMARHLRREGYTVGRKRRRRLMARMGLAPIYQRPRTTVPHPEHRVYPYLPRNLVIDRPNQVRSADLTYIPMRRGFLYLVAIMDWAELPKILCGWAAAGLLAEVAVRSLRRRPMPSTARPFTATVVCEPDVTLFAALELSLSRWVVVASAPGESKVSRHTLPACDGPALLALLDGLRRQAERRSSHAVTVVTIQEAGRDGFWLHRLLGAHGVRSHVVDPASIAVSRRHRRAKTDRIDAEGLLRALMAFARGERQVCSMVRPPTREAEDPSPCPSIRLRWTEPLAGLARRLTREREALLAERVRHTNRIKGLLATQGEGCSASSRLGRRGVCAWRRCVHPRIRRCRRGSRPRSCGRSSASS